MREWKQSKDFDLKIIKDEILIAMEIFSSNANNQTWAMLPWSLVTWNRLVTWNLIPCNVSNVRARAKVKAKVPMHGSSNRNKNISARLIMMLILRKSTTRASRSGFHLYLAYIAVVPIGTICVHGEINLIGSTIIWINNLIHCV